MTNGFFDPSSSDKLEGAMSEQLDPPVAMGSPDLSATGPRLPGAPQPDKGIDPRPDAALITAPPMRYAPRSDEAMLALSRQSFNASDTYFNANHRNRIIEAMARFNSEHPAGSKYHTPAFEKRSRLFRPKTRSIIRKREAAAAISLFGSSDILSVKSSSGDPGAAQDARIQEGLLNHRLQEDKRWYMFTVGAVQDADRQGVAIAKTFWDYDECSRYYNELHPQLGTIKRVDTVATRDRPGFSLIPVENFRFSPAADWMDVVGTSPYLIEVMPVYLCDVMRQMRNPNAAMKYRQLTANELLVGGNQSQWDAIRMQRERNAQSRYERQQDHMDYAIVWVHRNIMKIDGEDYVYDTVGTTTMLSEVMPLSELDPRGYRPYVIGSTIIESHNPLNAGMATLMGPMQDEINDTANIRQDANKMATAGRMFVKRSTGLDLHQLARFVPGAAVEMENPETDVKWDRSPEAPRGSFEENQLLNTELDDLAGNFSGGTVSNNRNLNETVGGMQMLGESANQLTEYDLHTFVKTFQGEVLNQLLDLEKQWETDKNIAAIVGSKMGVAARRFWTSLNTESKVLVDVGFGATNPAKRVERMGVAFSTVGKFFPQLLMEADQGEAAKEIFSAVGISDISRFFPTIDAPQQSQDPQIKALQQQIKQLQAMAQPEMARQQTAIQVATLRAQSAEKIAQQAAQAQVMMKQAELKLAYIELQLEHEKNDIARGQLMLAREKLSNDISIQRSEFMLQQATAQASAAPPNVEAPYDSGNAQRLAAPDSQVNIPSFDSDAATAGDYSSLTGGK